MNKARLRKTNSQITKGGLSSSLWKLAMPMMIGALLQDLFSLIDLFFVGRLGYIQVAALSIAGAILATILMVAIGISAGTTALIAHFIGKKDYNSADNVLFQTIVISLVCSVLMALVGLFGTNNLLQAFGATADVIPAASEYLRINFTWSIVIFLSLAFNQALRGSGDAVTPLKILIVANIINIILDPFLIFGWWFFPRMEIAGSALATIISRAIGILILLRHFLFGHSTLHFQRSAFRINFILIGRMLKIGFFASLEVLLRQISLLLLLRLVTSFGVACLAAYGIAIRLRMGIMMFGFGMGISASVLIGQNMGAGDSTRAEKSGWKALKYYELIVIPLAVFLFIFAPQIIGVFNNNPEVLKIGSNLLRFVAVTLPFLASALVLGKGIGGAGDTIAPAAMTGIFQLGLRIPLAYLLVYICKLGYSGIWMGINASDICQGIMMAWYFKQGFWQKQYYKHRAILEQENIILAGNENLL